MKPKEQAARIRQALKRHPALKKIRVRMVRGTGYGWVDVWGSGQFSDFTEAEIAGFAEMGLEVNGNCLCIAPDGYDGRYTARHVLQILGV